MLRSVLKKHNTQLGRSLVQSAQRNFA